MTDQSCTVNGECNCTEGRCPAGTDPGRHCYCGLLMVPGAEGPNLVAGFAGASGWRCCKCGTLKP